MLNFLWQLIPTVVILGFLIFVHELGHFLACLWAGVRVEKFSIGFGPEVFRFERKGTLYAISAIPFGGFVKPAGESFSELAGKAPNAGDFLAARKIKRFGILVAGVAMNYAVAIILFILVFWIGHPVLKAKIGGFVEGYPAAVSDLKIGDEILALNGKAVKNWQEMTFLIFENEQSQITLDVNRGGERLEIQVRSRTDEGTDVFGEKKRISRIGITPSDDYTINKYPFGVAIVQGFTATINLTALTHKAIWRLITGRMSVKTLSGPIGIMVMTGQKMSQFVNKNEKS